MKEWSELLDQKRLDQLQIDLGDSAPQVFSQLLEILVRTHPDRIQSLKRAFQEGDFEGVEASAHALRSSASNLGLKQVIRICNQIEAHSRKKELSAMEPYVAQLDHTQEASIACLESWIKALPH